MKAYPEYKSSGIDWLGNIPQHWDVAKIGWLFDAKAGGDAKPELYSDIKDDSHPFPVYTNTLIEHQVYAYSSEAPFKAGSITVTGRGDIGHAFVREEDFDAIIRLVVLTPRNNQECTYFKYFIDVVIPFFTDSAAVGQLSASQIIKYPIAVPPISEQEAIAAYLDDVTEKVDALIAEKRKQVENLRSYRTSLITETITRGLNHDVPLRSSGIDWLGDIPEHWETTKLKYVGEARNGLTYSPDNICNNDNGILVLRSSNIQNDSLCFDDNVYVNKFVDDDLMMKEGDILICSRNGSVKLIGKCTIIPPNICATFGAFMMRYRSNIHKQFTLYLIRTTLSQYRHQFATSTINQLTNAVLGDMQIPLPPVSEQQAIAEFLDEKTEKIDALISELEKQLEELVEYKKAIISEAVTGKVDVRDWKPQN